MQRHPYQANPGIAKDGFAVKPVSFIAGGYYSGCPLDYSSANNMTPKVTMPKARVTLVWRYVFYSKTSIHKLK